MIRRTPSLASSRALRGQAPARGRSSHASRLRARNPPHGQLRIVRERRPDPDDHGIDQGAQPVQMVKAGRPVEYSANGPLGFRDVAVKRLTQLADNHNVVDP